MHPPSSDSEPEEAQLRRGEVTATEDSDSDSPGRDQVRINNLSQQSSCFTCSLYVLARNFPRPCACPIAQPRFVAPGANQTTSWIFTTAMPLRFYQRKYSLCCTSVGSEEGLESIITLSQFKIQTTMACYPPRGMRGLLGTISKHARNARGAFHTARPAAGQHRIYKDCSTCPMPKRAALPFSTRASKYTPRVVACMANSCISSRWLSVRDSFHEATIPMNNENGHGLLDMDIGQRTLFGRPGCPL